MSEATILTNVNSGCYPWATVYMYFSIYIYYKDAQSYSEYGLAVLYIPALLFQHSILLKRESPFADQRTATAFIANHMVLYSAGVAAGFKPLAPVQLE